MSLLVVAFMLATPFVTAYRAYAENGVITVGTVQKIKLKAYPIDSNDNWDVEAGDTKTISKNGGMLRICATAVLSDGTSVSEYQSDNWNELAGVGDGFEYKWDGNCVTVDPTGLITALKDGKTKITVTPKNEKLADMKAEITIETHNQGTGFITTKVTIVNAKGKAYGDDALKLRDSAKTQKVYCIVKFKDKGSKETKTLANYPSAPKSQKANAGALYGIKWTVSDGQYADVTADSYGVASVKAVATGTVKLRCAMPGGDSSKSTNMGLGIVYDSITLNINNGKTVNDGTPSDKITIKVAYEKDLEKVAINKTYTKEEFAALGAVTRTYTMTRGKGRYVTDKAYGVPLATLLEKLKIDTSDIRYFTLKANDGANPGKISASWLLKKTRYYLPNYDIGGSWQGKKQVPTMLALEDSWSDDSMETGEMNSGTCFRLMFGSATNNDSATDKSIKFINEVTIVLAGAPPSKHGDNNGGTGSGSGGGQGDGSGQGNASNNTDKGDNAGTEGGGSVGSTDNSTGEGDQENTKKKVEELKNESAWSIYQMMNKNNSDVSVLYDDPNLVPFAVGVALVLFIGAGAIRILLFKRRLK